MDHKSETKMNGSRSDITLNPRLNSRRNRSLPKSAMSIYTLVMLVVLTACSASTSTPTSPAAAPAPFASQPAALPTSAALPTATTAQQPTATNAPQQALSTTSIDPCQLVSSQEASKLAGVSFGQGKEGTTAGGLKSCTYSYQSSNTFTVDAAQAPDVATAKADRDQFLADLQANAQQLTNQGLNVTQVPDFADGAVIATANINAGGVLVNGSAIGVMKGTIFFGFSDTVIGGAAPSSTALEAEATTVLGLLP